MLLNSFVRSSSLPSCDCFHPAKAAAPNSPRSHQPTPSLTPPPSSSSSSPLFSWCQSCKFTPATAKRTKTLLHQFLLLLLTKTANQTSVTCGLDTSIHLIVIVIIIPPTANLVTPSLLTRQPSSSSTPKSLANLHLCTSLQRRCPIIHPAAHAATNAHERVHHLPLALLGHTPSGCSKRQTGATRGSVRPLESQTLRLALQIGGVARAGVGRVLREVVMPTMSNDRRDIFHCGVAVKNTCHCTLQV